MHEVPWLFTWLTARNYRCLLTSAVLMKCPYSGDGGTRDVFSPQLAVQHFIKSPTSPKILLGDRSRCYSVNCAGFSRFNTPESPITIITDRTAIGDAVETP